MMKYSRMAVSMVLLGACATLRAYKVNDKLSIGGVLAGAGQCQNVDGAPGASDGCYGALPFQPELGYRPSDDDEVYFKLGFAVGNGLNAASPFVVAPWAADLEDDVKNINGRNRDYLLTAWYKHSFSLGEDSSLGATLGIIDATDYLDDNAYANDEYTQFMNAALVNGPNVFLPSYDAGTALEWENGPWSLRGVYMNVGENDDGNQYNFLGAQLGYRLQTSFGEGNYRVVVDGTSKEFLNPSGTSKEGRASMLFSLDQEFGEVVGGFMRFGWQSDDAAVDYDAIYSGGLNFKGRAWDRAEDNIGVGLAYLNGGNLAISNTQVAETYYRWSVNEHLGVTADLQYMQDKYRNASDVDGFVLDLRIAAEF